MRNSLDFCAPGHSPCILDWTCYLSDSFISRLHSPLGCSTGEFQTLQRIVLAVFGVWALRWRHNDHDGVSNHQLRGWLLNRLFTRRSKKTPKLRVTGLSAGNSPGRMNSPHKGPVTRKILPFDDVIMGWPLASCMLVHLLEI